MQRPTTDPKSYPKALQERLRTCPMGQVGWQEFEEVCVEVLQFLFVPPLAPPVVQARTISGAERRDAVFTNLNDLSDNAWGFLFRRFNAFLIPFEFKNYDKMDIGKDEVLQVSSYLRKESMGSLAFLCGSKQPSQSAYIKRRSIFVEEGKVILFCTKNDLAKMLVLKMNDKDPSEMILQLLSAFFIEQE